MAAPDDELVELTKTILRKSISINQETIVDRELLAKAVTLSREATLIDFAFVKQISFDNFPLVGIMVADLIDSISIPVSLNDFSNLKRNSEKSFYGQGYNISYDTSLRDALEIDGSRVSPLTPENLDLASLIIQHLGLPSNGLLNVQAKLRKLVLYEIGGHYIFDSNQYDSIGTVVLQVPVEKGHEGGHWKVQHNGLNKAFMNDSKSDTHFYLSEFYGKCKHSMEKVTQGCKLALVFDLVCNNAKAIIPLDYPVILTALKEIKRSLNPWTLDFPEKNLSNNEFLCLEKSWDKQVLFFDLQENYEKQDLRFQLLRGKDKNLAHLLRCCSFLDVHLVNFIQQEARIPQPHTADSVESSGQESSKSGQEISWQWIDTEDNIRNLAFKLDLEQQCVGSFRLHVNSNEILQETEEMTQDSNSEMTTVKRCSYRSVLVIWPKHHSVWIYCRYGLPSLITRMENLLASTSQWQEEERQRVTRDLRQLINFCCAQPKLVWTNLEMQKGELTWKLLYFCITLRAREEGLALLKALGTDFEEECHELVEISSEAFEGIQNEQVAAAVAKFQCQIAGWVDMAELVQRIITPNRISKQLIPIIKLAECLLDVNCVEGAKMVGDACSTFFINMDHGGTASQASTVTQFCVQAYLGMVLTLERNPKTSDLTRMESFVIFFSRLRSSVQCRLVLDLEASDTIMKMTLSSGFMFHDMCRILSTDCNMYAPPVRFIAEDLLKCYIRFGNVEWLQSLISKICRAPQPSEIAEKFNTSKINFLTNIISSSSLLDLAESSVPAKSSMISLVNNYLLLLVDHFSTLIEKDYQVLIPETPDVEMPRREILQKSLSSCILFFMRMDRINYSMESFHWSLISSLLAKLTIPQLFHFLIQLFEVFTTTQHCLKNGTIKRVCEFLLTRMKEKVTVMHSREDILNVTRCFIQTGDESLIRLFLEQVCANEITGFWTHTDKQKLFKLLVSSCDIWGKLSSAKKLIILDTCNYIVINGINDIIRKLDFPSASTNIPPVLFECVQLFFLTEKNRFSDGQSCVAFVFQPLLAKLSNSQLMDLVIGVFVLEKNEYPATRKISRLYRWYLDTCRRFFSLNFVPLVKREVEIAVKLFDCLLWLNDDICWKNFAFQVCDSFPTEESNLFVVVIVTSEGFQKALLDFPPAFNAIITILNHWIDASISTNKTPFLWKQQKAVVHGHPQVEAFLRSDEERMSYYKFTSTKEAQNFCSELKANGPLNGFSVKATTRSKNSSSGKVAYCEIQKNRSHHKHLLQELEKRKSEVEGLKKLLASLLEEREKVNLNPLELGCLEETDKSTSSCEIESDICIVYQSSVTKRRKIEIPTFVLD